MTVSVDNPERTRWVTYLVLAVIFLLLAGVALFTFRTARNTAAAEEKANQLTAALTAAGLQAPPHDQIVHVLGDDGGAICADPNAALEHAVLDGQLTNGAAGPGQRPVIADSKVLQGQLMVMKTYCPDKLAAFTTYADNLKLADTVKE